jgi:hypothetical protein
LALSTCLFSSLHDKTDPRSNIWPTVIVDNSREEYSCAFLEPPFFVLYRGILLKDKNIRVLQPWFNLLLPTNCFYPRMEFVIDSALQPAVLESQNLR